MRYISTRDNSVQYTASQAIAQGLAKDGGLLTPFYIPKLPNKALEDLKSLLGDHLQLLDLGHPVLGVEDQNLGAGHVLKALEDLKSMAYQQRAVYIMKQFLEEFSVKELTDFANAAYGPEKFDSPAVAPVHTVAVFPPMVKGFSRFL